MAYNHSKEAGNLGDVWKHALLVSIANRISTQSRFRYVESHSGGPYHQLMKNGEWERGIKSILEKGKDLDHPYLGAARKNVIESKYEAGWLFFARTLSSRGGSISVTLCDLRPEVADAYRSLPVEVLPTNTNVDFHCSDGYSFVKTIEADLVFLDPPYHPDADADWRSLEKTCLTLQERNIPFLAWYPFYWHSRPARLINKTAETAWEVMWATCGRKPSQNLKGCGVLVSKPLLSLVDSARDELEQIAHRVNGTRMIVVRTPEAG